MWFTETPWPPIFLCAIIAALCIVDLASSGRRLSLFGVIGMAVASAAIFFIEQSIVTDAEQVEANVIAMTSGFEAGEVDTTLGYISPNAADIRANLLTASLLVEKVEGLRVKSLVVEMKSNGTRAVSDFRANADLTIRGYGKVGRRPSRWQFTWQKEGDEWKVVRVRRLNPLTGEEMGLQDRREA